MHQILRRTKESSIGKIDASFKQLLERWDAISNRYQKMTVSEARTKWMVPLLKELGFDPGFNKEDIVVDGDDKLRFQAVT